MITVSATTAREKLYELIEDVSASGKKIGITNKGETKAVLISQEEFDSMMATLETLSDPELMEGIRKGDADIKAGRVRDWEDIKKELGLDEADVSHKIVKSRGKRS